MARIEPNLFVRVKSFATQTSPQKSAAKSESSLVAGVDRLQLGTEKVSAEQVNAIVGERIAAHLLDILDESAAALGEGVPARVAVEPSPEAIAQRIFDLTLSLFDNYKAGRPSLGEGEARGELVRLLAVAVDRGIDEVLSLLRSMKVLVSGEVAENIRRLKELLAGLMERFAAEGLEEGSSGKRGERAPQVVPFEGSPERGEGTAFASSDDSSVGGLLPSGRSPSRTQTQLIPPESTVLAMVKKAFSRRISPSHKSRASSEQGVCRPPLFPLLVTLFGVAVFVNYLWEVLQMVFYQWWGASWLVGLLVCLQAALGDGLLVLALYGAGVGLFRSRWWILRPGGAGYAFLVFSGMAVAVAIELHALASGRWAYGALMPIIPGLGVGLLPVAQMMVIPPLVVLVTRRRLLKGARAPE